uniref:Integrase catalytic domain-containing protein n=1 Tax=Amphimedon queenslandica TaxID=400682 RepID=A0A1X7TP71_AMPQE
MGKKRFYWLGYERAVEHFVKSCRVCQLQKSPNPTTATPVGETKSFYPFEWLSWDITGPLPVTDKGNCYTSVVTDKFTKWVEAFPLQAIDSVTLTMVLVDEIVCQYSFPTNLQSDQGANLCNQVIDQLCKLLCISRKQT